MAKVKFGLKNAYYAMATIAPDGTATYAAPKKLPGAVSITLDPAGESTTFYADDQAYFTTGGNIGYTGSLELALIPDEFRKDCLGEVETAEGVLMEDTDASPKNFALLFEFTTDEKAQRHVFYNCVASRTTIAGQTKGESTEVSSETINVTATSVYNAAKQTSFSKAKVEHTSEAYANWYTSVYQPTA